MSQAHPTSLAFHRQLVLDELFDLSLYRALVPITDGELRRTLNELISVEAEHYAFWQRFFGLDIPLLDLGRRLKLRLFVLLARVFGKTAVYLTLEGIEVYGIRKYLALWDAYKDGPLGDALRRILEDEFGHEDRVVSEGERRIKPERIRNLFLGMNDGLVEILGAVAGFFGAFDNRVTVVFAAVTTALAGAFSMGAGAYAAGSSEREVTRTEERKGAFLGTPAAAGPAPDPPLTSGLIVFVSYLVGATVPVLPLLFGASTPLLPFLAAAAASALVTTALAFLSGMSAGRRVVMNLLIVAGAVAVTYALGRLVKAAFGVAL